MFKKKLVSLALAVSMVASLCACGGNTVSVSTDAADETTVNETNEETGEATEVAEPDLSENVEFSIFIPSRKADAIYDENTLTLKALGEKMNVTFDIDTVINSESKAKLASPSPSMFKSKRA